jgi:hypothetical protein
MIYTAKFNGLWATPADITGFYTSNWFSRSDSATNDLGEMVGQNQPRYGQSHLLCPAPQVKLRRSGLDATEVWSGRWVNGSSCLFENRQESGQWSLNIYLNKCSGTPHYTETTGPIQLIPDVEPDWNHVLRTAMVVDGMIFAFCRREDLKDLDPDDNAMRKGVSLCYWNENDKDRPPLSPSKWVLKHASDEIQYRGSSIANPSQNPTGGHDRGQTWMASGPWVPPGGTDAQGNILDFFIVWADYRTNGGSSGGQLFLYRCTRTAVGQPWDMSRPVLKVFEEKFEDASGNFLPNYPLSLGSDSCMHFHGAAVTFPPPGGEAAPRPMVVTVVVGDSSPNNRLVNLYRSDYDDYAEGPARAPLPPTGDPNTNPIPPSEAPLNGWTTYEDREGQRHRLQFSNAVYNPAQRTLTSSEFANYTHTGGTAPLRIMYPGQNIGVIGKTTDGVNHVLHLNRTISEAGSFTGPMSGYLVADSSIQGVLLLPTSNPVSFIMGGDEQGTAIHALTLADPSWRLDVQVLAGVPTHSATGYIGHGIDNPNGQTAGEDTCLGWLCFLGSSRRGVSQAGEPTLTDFVALVTPNSKGGSLTDDKNWKDRAAASVVLYSLDGQNWGELFAPNSIATVPPAYFVNDSVPEYFFSRLDNLGLYAVPMPSAGTTRLWRPLCLSGGGTNHLAKYTSGGVDAIEIHAGNSEYLLGDPGTTTTATPVARASLGSGEYADVPPPPCEGPIMRAAMLDMGSLGVWSLTRSSTYTPGKKRVKIRVWVWRMAAKLDADGPNVHPLSTPTSFSMKFRFAESAAGTPSMGSFGSERLIKGATVAGTGRWIPITMEATPSTDLAAQTEYVLHAVFNPSQPFYRQDFLLAWDFVQITAETASADIPGRSLRVRASAGDGPMTSATEKLILTVPGAVPEEPPPPGFWTMFAAFRLPDGGPDPFVRNRAPEPTNITALTIRDEWQRYLRIVLVRSPEDGGHKIKVIDHLGNAWEVSGPSSSDDGLALSQPLYFLRGRQILIGISGLIDGDGETPLYRLWISAGGTRVKFAEGGSNLSFVTPLHVQNGEPSWSSVDPIELFGIYLDDEIAYGKPDGFDMLEGLLFL